MTNWPGNQGPQGGYGGPNPIGGPQPPAGGGWSQPGPAQQPGYPPQPGYQQAPGYQQGWAPQGQPDYRAGGPSQPPFGGPPQPPKNRKPLIITLIAGGAVLLVAAIVGVIALAGGGSDSAKTGSAGDAVKGYLEALARGDAEEALSYSDDQPGTKEFLSEEILKKQIDKMPITNIKILGDDSTTSGIGMGQVHVSVSFGDKVSDETLMLKRSGKQWKLDHAAVKLDKLRNGVDDKAMTSVTLFGKPVPDAAVYVFPGWLDLGSSNPNLKVTANPVFLNGLSGYMSFSSTNIQVDVTEAGNKAADKAVRDAIIKCTQSSALNPPACPNKVNEPGALENSASWSAPELPKLDISGFSRYSLDSRFYIGRVEFPVSIKMSDGGTKTGTVSAYLSGDIDMSQNPPAVSFG